MSDGQQPGLLPTWAVVLCAFLVPLLLAVMFVSTMEYANRPTPGPAQPGEGQAMADRNNGIVMVHGLMQLGFVVFGVIFLPRTTLGRVLFLLIVIPFSALIFVVSFFSQVAK